MSADLESHSFLRRFVSAADASGFRVVQYGQTGEFPLLVAENSPSHPRLTIHLSAGIHGDEPAGSLALLTLMQQGWFDANIAWHIFPLLNPAGMDIGTRENRAGIDLNRDYRHAAAEETRAHQNWLSHTRRSYDAALALHEDWESRGFYLYEVREPAEPDLGYAILQAVEPFLLIDRSAEIDGFPARDGLLRPHADASLATVEQWPEQLFLRQNHTALSLTFETPSAFPLQQRILGHIVAVKTAVNRLLTPRIEDTFDI